MVKMVMIIEPGNAANAREDDGRFDDTFIVDRGKLCDIISSLLHVRNAWPHVKSARNNCNGRKATLAFYDNFGGTNNVVFNRIRQR